VPTISSATATRLKTGHLEIHLPRELILGA
jgi:hypothetical protein